MARRRTHDELLDHEYDGIREYDNPCPAWWHLIFLGSVVFSVFYFIFFELGPRMGTNGWTVVAAHDDAEAANLMLRFAEIGELTVDEATLVEYMGKDDWLKVGAAVYARRCQSCHGSDGSGSVGPNLTDHNYKHVKRLLDVAEVVQNGAANGNMPAWRNQLHVNEVVLVSAYVASLRGQDLSSERSAEGPVIPPWPTADDLVSSGDSDSPIDGNEADANGGAGPQPDADKTADEPATAGSEAE